MDSAARLWSHLRSRFSWEARWPRFHAAHEVGSVCQRRPETHGVSGCKMEVSRYHLAREPWGINRHTETRGPGMGSAVLTGVGVRKGQFLYSIPH